MIAWGNFGSEASSLPCQRLGQKRLSLVSAQTVSSDGYAANRGSTEPQMRSLRLQGALCIFLSRCSFHFTLTCTITSDPGLLTICWLVFSKNVSAKTEMTETSNMKKTKRAMQDSVKKYLLASQSSCLSLWVICLDWRKYSHGHFLISCSKFSLTKAECRYMFSSRMTDPMMPTICWNCEVQRLEQDGTNLPPSMWISL